MFTNATKDIIYANAIARSRENGYAEGQLVMIYDPERKGNLIGGRIIGVDGDNFRIDLGNLGEFTEKSDNLMSVQSFVTESFARFPNLIELDPVQVGGQEGAKRLVETLSKLRNKEG